MIHYVQRAQIPPLSCVNCQTEICPKLDALVWFYCMKSRISE